MKISKSIKADLALVAITFVWGSTFTVVKQCLDYASPLLFIAMRFWIATAVAIAFMPRQIVKISRRTLVQGLALAVVLLGGFIFQTLGLRSTTPSHSAFITSLSVLLVPIFGFLIYRYKPRRQISIGILLATVGLFLMLVNLDERRILPGDVLTLICAVLFAFQILFLARFVAATDFRQLMILMIAGTAVFATILIPVVETPFVTWDPKFVLYLFIMGIGATTLTFYVQARAQRFTTANRAALIFSLEPIFAALFAYWMLGQVLTAIEWLGGILVLAGVLVAEFRFTKRGIEEDAP